jgi:hypothetical protein
LCVLYAMPEYIEGFKRALSDAKAGGKNRTANKIEKRHKDIIIIIISMVKCVRQKM